MTTNTDYVTAKPIKTSGGRARTHVQAKENFKNHNGQLFGRWETPLLYVVYSYGSHWPLFAWDGFEWYENEDRCSMTTSKHRSQTHPLRETTKLTCNALKARTAMIREAHRQLNHVQTTLCLAA
jgi:hypothetical protein